MLPHTVSTGSPVVLVDRDAGRPMLVRTGRLGIDTGRGYQDRRSLLSINTGFGWRTLRFVLAVFFAGSAITTWLRSRLSV